MKTTRSRQELSTVDRPLLTSVWHLRVACGLLTSALMAGCSASPQRDPTAATDFACAARPPGESPRALPELSSTLGLEVDVSEKWLTERLDLEVPYTLAKAKNQAIGSAGRVTYDVQRSRFTLAASDHELVVSTQLSSQIDVCKPVGPFCVAYGSCQPTWRARVTLPVDFDVDAKLRAQTEVSITRGCVLRPVGYDATSELRRITREQAQSVRQRIRRTQRQLESQLELSLQRVHRGLPLTEELCLQAQLTELLFQPPRLSQGKMRAAIQSTGQLRLECERERPDSAGAIGVTRSEPGAERKVAIVRRDALEPRIDLAVAVSSPLDALRSELEAALGHAVGMQVRHRAGATENSLYIAEAPTNACPRWLEVTPLLQGETLGLRAVGEPTDFGERLERLELSPPAELTLLMASSARFDEELSEGMRQAERYGLSLSLERTPRSAVEVDHDGLRFVYGIQGSARLSDEGRVASQP